MYVKCTTASKSVKSKQSLANFAADFLNKMEFVCGSVVTQDKMLDDNIDDEEEDCCAAVDDDDDGCDVEGSVVRCRILDPETVGFNVKVVLVVVGEEEEETLPLFINVEERNLFVYFVSSWGVDRSFTFPFEICCLKFTTVCFKSQYGSRPLLMTMATIFWVFLHHAAAP